LPFQSQHGVSTFILAFHVLPVIILVGAFSAVLWHWGILGVVVKSGGAVLRRCLGVPEAVSVVAFSNSFLSMVEAPLLIKPYLLSLSNSELFAIMVVGMATVAGGSAVVIQSILVDAPNTFAHVMVASLMNVPGALVVAGCLIPETSVRQAQLPRVQISSSFNSTMDALITGAMEGVRILVSVVAILIVFIAIVALINSGLALLSDKLSLQALLGYLFVPIVWLLGIPEPDLLHAGYVLGTKVVLNELVAYSSMADMLSQFSPYTVFVMTFALCGFGNIGSLAILTGGLTAMVPERRQDVASMGGLALFGAFLTNCITASIVALLYPIL